MLLLGWESMVLVDGVVILLFWPCGLCWRKWR